MSDTDITSDSAPDISSRPTFQVADSLIAQAHLAQSQTSVLDPLSLARTAAQHNSSASFVYPTSRLRLGRPL